MGEVRRVRDRVTGRVLAMKLLFPDRAHALDAILLPRRRGSRRACGTWGSCRARHCGALPDGRLVLLWRSAAHAERGDPGAADADAGDVGPAPEALRRVRRDSQARAGPGVTPTATGGAPRSRARQRDDRRSSARFFAARLGHRAGRAARPVTSREHDVEGSLDVAAILDPRADAGGRIPGTPCKHGAGAGAR